MNSAHFTSLFAIGIRLAILASRFLLGIILLDIYGAEKFGEFSLLQSGILIGVFLIGLEYYQIARREIMKGDPEVQAAELKMQMHFHLYAYIIFAAVLWLMGAEIRQNIGLLGEGIILLLLLLFSEHLSAEMQRVLGAIKRPIVSQILLFIKSSLWVYIIIAMKFMGYEFTSLDIVYYLWLGSLFISLLLGLYYLRKFPILSTKRLAKGHIWQRIKQAQPFLYSTMLSMALFYADRYVVNYFSGVAMVGIYVFFANLTRSIDVLMNAVVIQYLPNLQNQFQQTLKPFALAICGITLLGAIGLVVVLPLLLPYISEGKLLAENINVFYLLLISGIILSLTHIPHNILYVKSMDKQILISTIISTIITLSLLVFLTKEYGIYGSAIALIAGYSSLFIIESFFVRKVI